MQHHFRKEVQPAACLSLEEEAIQVAELADAQSAVDVTMAESDRVQAVNDGIEDVQEIAAVTPTIGNAEMALVAAVAEMAVAGTDACANELVSGVMTEEGAVANEGLEEVKNALKKIWEQIKAYIAKLWNDVKNFFDKTRGFLEHLKGRVAKSRESLKGAVKLKDGADIMRLPADANNFGFFVGMGSSSGWLGSVEKDIEKNRRYAENFVTKFPRAIGNVGNTVVEGLKNYKPDTNDFGDFAKKLDDSMTELLKIIVGATGELRWDTDGKNKSGSSIGRGMRELATFERQHGFFLDVVMPDPRATNAEEVIKAYSQLKIDARPQSEKKSELTVPVPPLASVVSSLDEMDKYITTLMKIYSGEGRKLIDSGADEIRKAGDAALAQLKGEDYRAETARAKKDLAAMMTLSSSYARWVGRPINVIVGNNARFIKMMLDIADTAIAQYTPA